MAEGAVLRWLLLACALLLIVLCDGLHGFHRDVAPAPQYSDSGQRDGTTESDQTAKARRRVATDLVHVAEAPQATAGLIPAPQAFPSLRRAMLAAAHQPDATAALRPPVLYLVRGQDPPAARG